MPLILLLGFIGLAGFCGFYLWGNSAYSVDLEGARKAVAAMEADKGLRERSCNPNRAVMLRSYWQSIPTERTKENVMNALARLCLAEGSDTKMILVDERGARLAEFDGFSLVK